ncbi:MAG TPA: hypothetical protein VGD40_02365 [Chryseosolibacter sp.]
MKATVLIIRFTRRDRTTHIAAVSFERKVDTFCTAASLNIRVGTADDIKQNYC